MHASADRRAQLLRGIESIRTLAERADSNAIDRLLAQPSTIRHLDGHTLDFLRRAQDLLLFTTQALATNIETQSSPGRHGRPRDGASNIDTAPSTRGLPITPDHAAPLDAAEAWRRAHLYLPPHHEEPSLIHIQEFDNGYQAIPIQISVSEPLLIPTIESATTLVIDKTTGAVTRWPLLPLDVLASQYRRYKREEPMTFDGHRQ